MITNTMTKDYNILETELEDKDRNTEKLVEQFYDPFNDNYLGILEFTSALMKRFDCKQFEVVFKMEEHANWNSFGGSVGYRTAEFFSLEDAHRFIIRGLLEQKRTPEIWLNMVEC